MGNARPDCTSENPHTSNNQVGCTGVGLFGPKLCRDSGDREQRDGHSTLPSQRPSGLRMGQFSKDKILLTPPNSQLYPQCTRSPPLTRGPILSLGSQGCLGNKCPGAHFGTVPLTLAELAPSRGRLCLVLWGKGTMAHFPGLAHQCSFAGNCPNYRCGLSSRGATCNEGG